MKCLACGLELDEESTSEGVCYYCGSRAFVDETSNGEILVQDVLSEQQAIPFEVRSMLHKMAYHQTRYMRFLDEGKEVQAREEYFRKLLLSYRVFKPPEEPEKEPEESYADTEV